MTRIGSYRGEAAFRTWTYRVAANHILNWCKSRIEGEHLIFRRFGEDLHQGLEAPDPGALDAALLAEEIKLGCTLGMLLCLDRDHRLAYVLSDVFDLPSADAAFICAVTPAAFRKRASRARAQLREFVSSHCGFVNRVALCRFDRSRDSCTYRTSDDRCALQFAAHITPDAAVGEMERLHELASLMRSHPDYPAPAAVTEAVRVAIDSGRFKVLE